MDFLHAQGAIESSSLRLTTAGTGNCLAHQTIARAEPPFCCAPERCDVLVAPLFVEQKEGLHAQGATEYLVLLAVVLIVALVSVALLGFFPGMASDAQITQSQAYWRGASPIAIVESGARTAASGTNFLYLRLSNTGAYPIRITGLVGGDGTKTTGFGGTNCGVPSSGTWNISDYFYMGIGDERYFAWNEAFGTACNWQIMATAGPSGSYSLGGASSLCQNSSTSPGTLSYKSLGFEYIEYIDGQQITKRQIGKDFIVKCLPPL